MRNHEALPGEPVEWHEAYAYANELIKEGILERELVIYQFSMFDNNESEEAYEWLVNTASKKHLNNFTEDDSDISTSPFLDRNHKDQEMTKELKGYLENTYVGPITKKKLGRYMMKITGIVLLTSSGLGMIKRIADSGEPFSGKFSNALTEAAVIVIGSLLLQKSIEIGKD